MTKKQQAFESVPSLPDWINDSTWQAYLSQRKTKRAANTEYALGLILKKLEAMRGKGHDPNSILDSSIEQGWTGVFEPRSVTPRQQTYQDKRQDRGAQWFGPRTADNVIDMEAPRAVRRFR